MLKVEHGKLASPDKSLDNIDSGVVLELNALAEELDVPIERLRNKLKRAIADLSPPLQAREMKAFRKFWIYEVDRKDHPRPMDLVRWVMKTRPSKTSKCAHSMCDGSGHVEIVPKEGMPKGHSPLYFFGPWCRCQGTEEWFVKNMGQFEFTQWQKDEIEFRKTNKIANRDLGSEKGSFPGEINSVSFEFQSIGNTGFQRISNGEKS